MGLIGHWTEHGDRALLVSWAAAIGDPKQVRDLLGRWSPSGSDEYVRTARATVLSTQQSIATTLRTTCRGRAVVGEKLLFDEIAVWFRGFQWEEANICRALHQLDYFSGNGGGYGRRGGW